MPTYYPGDIIGKTLFAKTTVILKLLPDDLAPVYTYILPGETVGVVYSYILPKHGRNKNLYWQFQDNTGRLYYAEQQEGKYDLQALKSQGVKSTEEKQEEAQQAGQTWQQIGKYFATGVLVLLGVAIVAPRIINKLIK